MYVFRSYRSWKVEILTAENRMIFSHNFHVDWMAASVEALKPADLVFCPPP